MAKLILKNVRFSYANVFTPKAITEGADLKYSVSALIDKNHPQLAEIKEAISKAIAEGVDRQVFTAKEGEAFKAGQFPSNFKNPLRDGDKDKPGNEEYKGMYFIAANSKDKPTILSTERDEFTKKLLELSEADFYSGCYGNISLNLYAFKKAGNIGIGAGLNGCQKTKDGERLSGGSSAWEDFDDEGSLMD